MMAKKAWPAVVWAAAGALLLAGLHAPAGGLLRLGPLLDPWDGLYRTARMAEHPARAMLNIEGVQAPVTVERDARGVPHIFAENDWDALTALGYVVAQDRLFQMDFAGRVASGRLSEIFGAASVESDRFLRGTGMEWAARSIAREIREDAGLELKIITAFARGANAYIGSLDDSALPLEFRLFGYRPAPYSVLTAARLMQFFNFDLSYETDDVAFGILRERLGEVEFARLYPRHSPLSVPIVPPDSAARPTAAGPLPALLRGGRPVPRAAGPFTEGFQPGKGSNNWAVTGARSATGHPLLAGDMHLDLALPAVWYEAHLVTPEVNLYGVLSPGTPLLVEAYNEDLGWTFTNMGADAVDFYALELDSTGRRYRFDDAWRALTPISDTIRVRGAQPVISTRWRTHMGPVVPAPEGPPLAMRWAAYESNHTLIALWHLARARHVDEADSALRHWGAPAQNVMMADRAGNIAVRSAGHVPMLAEGGSRAGVLDGRSSAAQWHGRLPHQWLPYAKNPARGYLTSSNQQPTGPDYPHYLGHNWPPSYRALRIETLLSGKAAHGLEDMMAYQRDVRVVQRDLIAPHLEAAGALTGGAAALRDLLTAWDGVATTDRIEPLALYTLMELIYDMAWDEAVFEGMPRPRGITLITLLGEGSPWLDVVATPAIVEDAPALVRRALEACVDTMAARYGSDPAGWRWGTHHRLTLRHLTRVPQLSALWSDTYEYPGFDQTLSPGTGLAVSKSASWRVIVDFATDPPRGYGVYPGGQSGNPFSTLYDLHMETYVNFEYYELHKPTGPGQLEAASVLTIRP